MRQSSLLTAIQQIPDYQSLLIVLPTRHESIIQACALGLTLRQVAQAQSLTPERIRQILRRSLARLEQEARLRRQWPPAGVLLSTPIADLPLSERARNGLLNGGYDTLGKLTQCRSADLLVIKNLGRKSLTEIEEVLTRIGLSLSPSTARDTASA